MLRALIVLYLLVGSSVYSTAQFGCIDELLIIQDSYCPPDFEPVCGCDGNTYRNSCIAQQHFGVLRFEDGLCSGIAFDIYPNPVSLQLNFTAYLSEDGPLTITISDLFGSTHYLQRFTFIDEKISFPITEVASMRAGVYILVIESRGSFYMERFVKTERLNI